MPTTIRTNGKPAISAVAIHECLAGAAMWTGTGVAMVRTSAVGMADLREASVPIRLVSRFARPSRRLHDQFIRGTPNPARGRAVHHASGTTTYAASATAASTASALASPSRGATPLRVTPAIAPSITVVPASAGATAPAHVRTGSA